MANETQAPTEMIPPHGVENHKLLTTLTETMKRHGWEGRPILVVNGACWTGSHRIAAAVAAGLDEVPVLAVEIPEDVLVDFGSVTDDDDRLALLEAADETEAAWLMSTEIAYNA